MAQQQASPRAAAVHQEWTALVNKVFADFNSGKPPTPDELRKFERLVRWGLHIPQPGAASQAAPAEGSDGATLASRLMQAGQTFMEKFQPTVAAPPPAAAAGSAATTGDARLERERQARDPQTDSAALERLVADADPGVRLALANNPRLPPALLTRLWGDQDRMVRAAVAVHPGTPQETLMSILNVGDKLVLLRLAQNPHAPPDALQTLSSSEEPRIQAAVVENPGATSDLIGRIQTQCPDVAVRNRAREVLIARGAVHERVMPLDQGR